MVPFTSDLGRIDAGIDHMHNGSATALFDVDGVERVYLGGDFITITKAEAIEWPHLKPHVLAAIMDHFTSDRPVLRDAAAADETNEADIVYEGEAADIVKELKELKDFRPISCCNSMYKFISKCLTNRLQQVIGYLISPSQSIY